jgi:hypothetical protein
VKNLSANIDRCCTTLEEKKRQKADMGRRIVALETIRGRPRTLELVYCSDKSSRDHIAE